MRVQDVFSLQINGMCLTGSSRLTCSDLIHQFSDRLNAIYTAQTLQENPRDSEINMKIVDRKLSNLLRTQKDIDEQNLMA
jgi:hypothetical protein